MRDKVIKIGIVFLIILCSIFAIIFSLEIRKGGDFSFVYENLTKGVPTSSSNSVGGLAGVYIG
ncbi:MAG: hypothetical protein Q7R78_02160, partial [bacterium]|nr:hypothetical protein [bacterium]